MDPSPALEALLEASGRGDRDAEARLVEAVYDELRRMASNLLRTEGPGHTLQTSALVHEAYLRLTKGGPAQAPNRNYFFSAAARAMRRILIDHARQKQAVRRDGGRRIDFDSAEIAAGTAIEQSYQDILVVDRSLQRLADLDPRQATIVELRFFGGLSVEETAAAVGVSEATVKRDWIMAKAWLKAELYGSSEGSAE